MEKQTWKGTTLSTAWMARGVAVVGVMGALLAGSAMAQAKAGEKQCNLAVVTKLTAKAGETCDEKTIRQMAKDGQVYEQNQMGIASVLAIGPGYNTEEALRWFERAAQRGYAPAQVNAAVMYSNGWGTAANYGRALHWLEEAASQNYPRAYFDLGILYLQGKGVRQDDAKAFDYFRRGAEAGDASAQSNVGYMYDRGRGTVQNTAKAVEWYSKAADQGEAMGQNNLADMYLRGDGVPQDDKMAFNLFQQAAEHGHTGARIKLAYMYSEGRGTTKNLLTAYAWAESAASDARGNELRASLEKQLSKEQLASGKEEARKLSSPEPPVSAKALLP